MKIVSLLFLFSIHYASDQIPAPVQNKPVLIKGGTIFTISHGVMEKTDILFDNGVISEISSGIKPDENTEIIDASGKHIYPGLISAISTLGLQEIGAVRATRDYAETGSMNPNVRANVSYNPDSELIPISRSNGILLANSVPRSGRISGISSLMMLDGWTWEEASLIDTVALHIFWPSMNQPKSEKDKQKNDKEKKNSRLESIQELDDFFEDARAYQQLKSTNSPSFKMDMKFESMKPFISGRLPVFIHANEVRQIEASVYWAIRNGLFMVLVGGKDSWRVLPLLKEKNISVIYTQTHSQPSRRFEDFDQSYKTPNLLYEGGVSFCISNSESPFQTPHIRNLPYHAAKAGSYGLPWNEALRSITLSSAEILGVSDRIGSLEIGKEATLFIADGDILEVRTQVVSAFIQGRKIDLSDRHKDLYDKYEQKYRQKGMLD